MYNLHLASPEDSILYNQSIIPGVSDYKQSSCNAGDPSLILG